MRPSDENQHSARPNLMSSNRRGGNEESILAMLERDGGRGGRRTRSRLALFAVGGAVAIALLGALAWVAHENENSPEVLMAQAPAVVTQSGHLSVPPPLAAEPAAPPQAATIVDEPQPEPVAVQPREPHTPMPQVARQEPVPPKAAATTATTANATAAKDKKVVSTPEKTKMVARAEARHAAKAAGRQDNARLHGAAKAGNTARHVATRPAKPKKQVQAAKPVEAVDSDVALISAVIMHATNHPGASQSDCGAEPKCAAKATPQQ